MARSRRLRARMLRLKTLFAGTVVLLSLAQAASAQSNVRTSSPARAYGGALLGGAAGALVGGLAGVYIGGNRCVDHGNPDSCDWLRGLVVGTAAGVTIGAPVGAHLLNRKRGKLPYGLVASALIGGAGVLAFRAADDRARGENRHIVLNSIIVTVPLLQVILSGFVENQTSRP